MKWVYILKLLLQDPITGDAEWETVVRSSPMEFSICIENVVDTVNTLEDAGIRHDVYCKEINPETYTDEPIEFNITR